jgi:N-ethylmaleimide reductase
MEKLFAPFSKGTLKLKNHLVMAPMTRSRATDNLPNELMATYYAQRSGAGMIVTEGTSPSPEGLGYSRIPGIYADEQVNGWKKVTDAVHQNGSKIFL